MFCGQCGTKNEGNGRYCKNCGAIVNAEVHTEAKQTAKSYTAPNQTVRSHTAPSRTTMLPKTSGDRKIGKFALIAAVVIVAFVGFMLFGGRSANATAKQYAKAVLHSNEKDIAKLLNKKEVKYFVKEKDYDKGDVVDKVLVSTSKKIMDLPKEVRKDISYKIVSSDSLDGSELDMVKSAHKKMGTKVSAAKTVKIQFIDREAEDEYDVTLNLVKIGRSWYLDPDPSGLSGFGDALKDFGDALNKSLEDPDYSEKSDFLDEFK